MATTITFDRIIDDKMRQGMIGVVSLIEIRSGPEIRWICDLKGELLEGYTAIQTLIDALGTVSRLLDASVRNYDEFVSAFDGLRQLGLDARSDALRNAFGDEINRRLGNYLSSMRLFLDCIEATLKRLHTNTGTSVSMFKSYCSALFDSSFPYRFAYKLRNYSQHFGMPVGDVSITDRLIDECGDERRSHEITVAFNPEELLAIGRDLWGPVRRDLEACGSRLDVGNVMREVPRALDSVWLETLFIESDSLRLARRVLEELLALGTNAIGQLVVGQCKDHNGLLGITYVDPPSAILSRLENDLNRRRIG